MVVFERVFFTQQFGFFNVVCFFIYSIPSVTIRIFLSDSEHENGR